MSNGNWHHQSRGGRARPERVVRDELVADLERALHLWRLESAGVAASNDWPEAHEGGRTPTTLTEGGGHEDA